MNKLYFSPLALALAMAATPALAQDAGAPPPDPQAVPPAAPAPDTLPPETAPPAPQDAAPPAPDASAQTPPPPAAASAEVATNATVTDAEVASFAQATVKVREISADTAADETAKQQRMVEAVSAAGLDPARFNAIGKAVGSDADLRARVQTAMTAHAGHEG